MSVYENQVTQSLEPAYLINPDESMSMTMIHAMFVFDRMYNHNMDPNYSFRDYINTDTVLNQFNAFIIEIQPTKDKANRFKELDKKIRLLRPFNYVEHALIVKRIQMENNITFNDITDEMYLKTAELYQKEYEQLCYMKEVSPGIAEKPFIKKEENRYPDTKCDFIMKGAAFEAYIQAMFMQAGYPLNWFTSVKAQENGENEEGYEIKNDTSSRNTGNYYIEICEYTNKDKDSFYCPVDTDYTLSGIMKDDNTKFFIIGIQEEYYFVRKEDLLHLLKQIDIDNKENRWRGEDGMTKIAVTHKDRCHSKGMLVKKQKIQEIAVATSVQEFVEKYYIDESIKEYRETPYKQREAYTKEQVKQLLKAKEVTKNTSFAQER